jgi:ATP-dependent DNA ligase
MDLNDRRHMLEDLLKDRAGGIPQSEEFEGDGQALFDAAACTA